MVLEWLDLNVPYDMELDLQMENNVPGLDELLELEAMQVSDDEDDDVLVLSSDSEDQNEIDFGCVSEADSQGTSNTTNITLIGRKKPELSNVTRASMVQKLMKIASSELKIPQGSINDTAAYYNVHRTTVFRIWSLAKSQVRDGNLINVESKKPGTVGRKPKVYDEEYLRSIPIEKRTTIRSFASALECSPSTIVKLLKKGIVRSHSSSIKPSLTPRHKILRLQWVMSKIIPRSMRQGPRFECLMNLIHIDEKWFYMSRTTQKFYLLANEEEPCRSTQNKNFIEKVMFLAAIARPQITESGEVMFDGKIGIWPFTETHVALRNSCNRPAGETEIKALTSITKDIIRQKIKNELIPAIKSKWPSSATKCIWVQQDNARPHISPTDKEFIEAANSDGFSIQLICQPAQSPDLNVLDLGFFRAIQALQHQKFPKNTVDLIKSVQEAYDEYDPKLISFTWLQLQYVMAEILRVQGGNNYKNPHIGKKKLESIGQLPFQVEVPELLIDETVALLNAGITHLRNATLNPDEVPGYCLLD